MTSFDPQKHHRRSIRLPGYDYSHPGAYYVTILSWGRECLFGEVVNGVMRLNRFGEIVHRGWVDLPRYYPHVVLDEFICMPNHVHGIVVLRDDDGRGGSVSGKILMPSESQLGNTPLPDKSQTRPYTANRTSPNDVNTRPNRTIRHGLPEIIRALKSFSARRINILRETPGVPVWQRNYYEHIIRDESELTRVRAYILDNPSRWEDDRENPLLTGNPHGK